MSDAYECPRCGCRTVNDACSEGRCAPPLRGGEVLTFDAARAPEGVSFFGLVPFGPPQLHFASGAWLDMDVLVAIAEERARQRAAHGDGDHADVPGPGFRGPLADLGAIREAMQRETVRAFGEGRGTWGHILVEEVVETLEAGTVGDAGALERELVQVAAVSIAWLEKLRARRAGGDGR